MSVNVDLHCHSTASDGSLSCRELIERAVGNGVEILAITDHDTTISHQEAALISKELTDKGSEIKIIPAAEISTVSDNQELHIVALNIDPKNVELQSLLAENRQTRKVRATRILERLKKSGLDDLTHSLEQIVTGDVVCRSHLAQMLCSEGIVKDFNRAFKRYLGKSGKAWVPVQWRDISDVIERIKNAGGIAILAHPSKYKLSNARLGLVIESFVKAGGEALEIAYPGLNPAERAKLVRQVNLHQLAVSQGSDFHHPGTKWTELGAFGVNPASFKTVWQQL